MEENDKKEEIFLRLPVIYRFPIIIEKTREVDYEKLERELLRKLKVGEDLTDEERGLINALTELEYSSEYTGKKITDLEVEVLDTLCEIDESFQNFREAIKEEEEYYGKFFTIADVDDSKMILVSPDTLEGDDNDIISDSINCYEEFEDNYVYLHHFFLEDSGAKKVFQLFEKKELTDENIYSDDNQSFLECPDQIVALYMYYNMYLCCKVEESSDGELVFCDYLVLPDYIINTKYDFVGNIPQSKSRGDLYLDIVKWNTERLAEKKKEIDEDDYPDSYQK